MKKSIKNYTRKISSLALILVLLGGCSEYFENPLNDKETGEGLQLLLVDFNFFTTRITFKLFDANDSTTILTPANVRFSGKNGDNIVNFSGEKKTVFSTTQGQLELTIDPNVEFSASTPFEFGVNAEVEGYKTFNKGFHISTEGKKTYELYLVKKANEDDSELSGEIDINDGDTTIVFNLSPEQNLLPSAAKYRNNLKSAVIQEKPYNMNFKISISDFLKLKDKNGDLIFESYQQMIDTYIANPSKFASLAFRKYSDYAPGVDVIYHDGMLLSVQFQKLETGTLSSFKAGGEKVEDLNGATVTSFSAYTGETKPPLFGSVDFKTEEGAWYFGEPADTTVYETLDISYTLAQAADEGLCEMGSEITFVSSVKSSFSIDADVYDMADNLINSMNFKGNFPETFTVENVPSEAVRMVFRNNNPSFEPIPTLEIDNFCTGNYEVNVSPTSGYDEFQLVLKAICPDNPTVGIAPTYSGEVKMTGSSEPWQGVDMVGGTVDLLGKTGNEYELRLLWENEWEYATFSLVFNADGSYAGQSYPRTEINSEYIDNGDRIRINVKKEFNQSVCDGMNW